MQLLKKIWIAQKHLSFVEKWIFLVFFLKTLFLLFISDAYIVYEKLGDTTNCCMNQIVAKNVKSET